MFLLFISKSVLKVAMLAETCFRGGKRIQCLVSNNIRLPGIHSGRHVDFTSLILHNRIARVDLMQFLLYNRETFGVWLTAKI